MTISRELTEGEILPAIIAGLVAAQQSKLDIPLAVGTAERIVEEIVQRVDNPNPPSPLPPGVLHVDEFSSQLNDGTGKTSGIHVEWFRSDEIGPAGNALTPEQVSELFLRVVSVVETFAEEVGLQALYDRD